MIRTIVMLAFWGLAAPVVALVGFPWTFITGNASLLYRMFMFGCRNGVRLTGVRVQTVGPDKLDAARTYIFMSNHVSILGRAMLIGSMVPVDRGNRGAGIESVRIAKQVVQQGLNMTIYVEGHRSL